MKNYVAVFGVFRCLLLFAPSPPCVSAANETFRFGILPKSLDNPFFDPVRTGCEARADVYGNVVCVWIGPEQEEPTGAAQVEWIDRMIDQRLAGDPEALDGLAISVVNEESVKEPIRRALDSGMSVICFDSDAANSDRQAYVGTDNVAFGEQLGKVLLQLQPTGGMFALVSIQTPNLELRVRGIRSALSGSTWTEPPDSILYEEAGNITLTLQNMRDLKVANPDLGAIIPLYGTVMQYEDLWIKYVDSHRDLTHVIADAGSNQISLLERGFADGLVGQLPYQSGEVCIDTLLNLRRESGGKPSAHRNSSDLVFGTNLSLLLRIPLILPTLTVDQNFVGNYRILGYVLFCILASLSIVVMAWVLMKRKTYIVRASQPIFLIVVAVGALIMSSSIIPIGFDNENYSVGACSAACIATPWLLSIGFSTVFSALFSKLWRINRVVESAQRFNKQVVTVRDVILPFCLLMVANLIILICWTVVAPLEYVRRDDLGTDPWNRVISSYGTCMTREGQRSVPFVSALVAVNLGALLFANIQAYKARSIQSEFSESKYIALVVAGMMQVSLVGLPVLLLTVDNPPVYYLLRILLVFVITLAIIGLIFVPKMLHKPKENGRQVVVSYGTPSADGGATSTLSRVSNSNRGDDGKIDSNELHVNSMLDLKALPKGSVEESSGVTSIAAIRAAAARAQEQPS
jgi:ABC-type sugar transport system substrate-binding protein